MTVKTKAPRRSLDAVFRTVFLAAKRFNLPTHAPYDESLRRLRGALQDETVFVFQERVDPEDADSATFEVRLRYFDGYDRKKDPWRTPAIARGRVVAQPVFGDAMLTGEIYDGWWDVVVSWASILLGGLAALAFVLYFLNTSDVGALVVGGGLGLVWFVLGLMRWHERTVSRGKLLAALAAIFEP